MAAASRARSSSSAALALLLLLLLQQQQKGAAFEAPAHEAISMTALSGLTMQANQALRRLLNGKDVADVSGWAHRVTEKYPLTAPLHFQRQQTCPSPPPTAANTEIQRSLCSSSSAAADGCLLEALTYFFYRLTAPEKNQEPRDPADPVIRTDKFVFPHGIETTDADAVKYVINLIGDMHEPLHWGSSEDDFGRTIFVEYEAGDGTREKQRSSLYEFIEGAFIKKIMGERQTFWYSGWTHVNSVKSFYEEEKTVFAARKETYFLSWARENRALLCAEIYPLLSRMTKKKDEPNVYVLDRTSEFLFFEIIKKRILVAGARTAVVMNHILQVRGLDEGLGQLRAGSGIQDVQETADARPPAAGESYLAFRRCISTDSNLVQPLLSTYQTPAAAAAAAGTAAAALAAVAEQQQ
ncbi:hypothetical protein, conserved [Eimeria tenella]|uniref:S1/P1nuclease n=1 Tax=Eimeria tenella TaxID=5802 RepID=U6KGE7_EIMTE|nr:hypothetical protein, conserved [Eimeria tenella]CDJ37120.1 hypothetical protein, conserved [Eimeria tenella]|eukprot:XP_013227958.1 hypothetical protein, conserved [Eimeria tenella]